MHSDAKPSQIVSKLLPRNAALRLSFAAVYSIPSLFHSAQQHSSPCQAIAHQPCSPPTLDKARRFIPLPLQAFSFPCRCKSFLYPCTANLRLPFPFHFVAFLASLFRLGPMQCISAALLALSLRVLSSHIRSTPPQAIPTQRIAIPWHIHNRHSLTASGSWPSAAGTPRRPRYRFPANTRAPVPRPAS